MANNDGEVTIQPVTVEVQQVFELARTDMNILGALCLGESFIYKFPPVFLSIWQWLTSEIDKHRGFPKLAVGLPRGFAKTSVLKLFILYAIFFSRKQYILVVCASLDKSIAICAAVKAMLDDAQVRTIFGDYTQSVEVDTKERTVFWIRGRQVILRAAGALTSIRGANEGKGNKRPDLIIFDDIQDLESSDSEAQWQTMVNWFQKTALKTRSPFGCMYVFLANMYPTRYSMLKWISKNPDWLKYITGAILADGTSLWEELFPLEQLIAEYKEDLNAGMPEAFFAELMNDPNAKIANKIDYSALPACPYQNLQLHSGNFIMIDPSGGKKTSDNVSIGYFTIQDGISVLTEVIEGKMSPGDTIKNALKLALRHNCTLIVSESNGYQETLLYWFGVICEAQGIMGITLLPEYPGVLSKNQRIATMLQAWMKGEIFVAPACMTAVLAQVKDWDPLKKENTDGLLDLLVYAIRIAAKFNDYFAAQTMQAINNSQNIRVVDASTNSPI